MHSFECNIPCDFSWIVTLAVFRSAPLLSYFVIYWIFCSSFFFISLRTSFWSFLVFIRLLPFSHFKIVIFTRTPLASCYIYAGKKCMREKKTETIGYIICTEVCLELLFISSSVFHNPKPNLKKNRNGMQKLYFLFHSVCLLSILLSI